MRTRTIALAIAIALCAACGQQNSPTRDLARQQREQQQKPPPMTAKILPRTWAPIITGILEKPPRDQYEASLVPMLLELMAPDAIQQYCAQWFPDSGRETGDAFIAWRKRHEAMQTDITKHVTALWLSNAGDWPDAVPRIRPALRKEMVENLLQRFDAMPVEDARKECKEFPRQLASRDWDLEKRFKKQLAVMRAHPLGTTS